MTSMPPVPTSKSKKVAMSLVLVILAGQRDLASGGMTADSFVGAFVYLLHVCYLVLYVLGLIVWIAIRVISSRKAQGPVPFRISLAELIVLLPASVIAAYVVLFLFTFV